ncbi:MAG: hypothetical protein LC795_02945 [Acidobacteria bacterium]|nr:hypothetical protein [Acidobacteriota bacterium]
MKTCLLGLLLVFVAASPSAARAQGRGVAASSTTLTNASVLKLVRAGFREKTLIAIINSRPVSFDLSPDRLIELKKGGVPERVILAMLARADSVDFASDEWDDEQPLDGGFGRAGRPGTSAAQGPPASDPGEVNIFGSAGGSSGRTRTRGGSGGGNSDTMTTGSASVRIIRPPAEAGGAAGAAKLERTPTLTNDSVVELVEAGFSEGTIVRRIEQSPVEFDLSPARLAELRKRRVSEPVINAMRAAMGEDAREPAAHPEK